MELNISNYSFTTLPMIDTITQMKQYTRKLEQLKLEIHWNQEP